MTTMTSNGHQLVPLGRPLELRGDVSALPQPAKTGWRRHVMTAAAVRRAWPAAVPVVLVNAVAFGAQLGFWNAHLAAPVQAVLVALALESIAVYLAYLAHLAQLADDSSLRLRLAAYGIALLIGTLNYSHFMRPGWRPTVAAVTFGMMSAISPWLWSVHSRRVSRDALKARGLIEPHAVRLGATRWTFHAYRSFRVMRWAAWTGENEPARAIAAVYPPAAATEDATGGDKGDSGGDTGGKPSPPKDKLSVEEEAARDGVSPGAVRKRRERARKAAADRSRT